MNIKKVPKKWLKRGGPIIIGNPIVMWPNAVTNMRSMPYITIGFPIIIGPHLLSHFLGEIIFEPHREIALTF